MNSRNMLVTTIAAAAAALVAPAQAQTLRYGTNGSNNTVTVIPQSRFGSRLNPAPEVVIPAEPGSRITSKTDAWGKTEVTVTDRWGNPTTTTIERGFGGSYTVNGEQVERGSFGRSQRYVVPKQGEQRSGWGVPQNYIGLSNPTYESPLMGGYGGLRSESVTGRGDPAQRGTGLAAIIEGADSLPPQEFYKLNEQIWCSAKILDASGSKSTKDYCFSTLPEGSVVVKPSPFAYSINDGWCAPMRSVPTQKICLKFKKD